MVRIAAALARRAGAFLHQLPWIAVQLDAEFFCDSFAFCDQIIEQLVGGLEAGGGSMMQ